MPEQQIFRSEHNHIPVMWSQIEGTYNGALIFGVGVQDETPIKSGITHLLEHLVMSQVGDVAIQHNAMSDGANLTFYAQGPEHLVADFLNRVAASISGLDKLTHAAVTAESAHIAAELGDRNGRTGTGPLLERYGAATYGLLDLGFPAHRSLTLSDALDWAETYLHAGNAVLTCSGPPPNTLDVVLPPSRPVPDRATPEPLPYRKHGWLGGGLAPVALSLDLVSDNRDARFVALNVMEDSLFEELRTERHLVYSVRGLALYPKPSTAAVTYWLDPQPENILATAEAALAILRTMAANGPSQEILDKFAERWRIAETDPSALYANLAASAARWLRTGLEPRGIGATNLDGAGLGEIRQIVANALDTVLVSFAPFETELTPEQVSERLGLPWACPPPGHYESQSASKTFSRLMRSDTTSFDPKRSSKMRGQQLVVDPERIAWVAPAYGVRELRWDQLVLAGRCTQCGLWDLTDSHGAGMYVQPGLWRGGEKLTANLNDWAPAQARYPLEHAFWH